VEHDPSTVQCLSVPSRLIGERVRVRIYDDRLEVLYGGQPELEIERLHGRNGHRIDYRHVVSSLIQRPGAFARYQYREDLFPSLIFRRTYDALISSRSEWSASLEYIKILRLAAQSMESEVSVALEAFLSEGETPDYDRVVAVVAPKPPECPELSVLQVDLREYDALLPGVSA